jgi:large subunit ribosomal protein L32e
MVDRKIRPGAKPRKGLATKLRLRKTLKSRKPSFRRQEGYRHVKLRNSWRRPRGRHSKLRLREKARGRLPGAGYGSPGGVRGLNRLGYREVRVATARELEALNPKEEMAVLAGSLGKKRRGELLKLAGEKEIQVSNA